jgi:hypothetical protein
MNAAALIRRDTALLPPPPDAVPPVPADIAAALCAAVDRRAWKASRLVLADLFAVLAPVLPKKMTRKKVRKRAWSFSREGERVTFTVDRHPGIRVLQGTAQQPYMRDYVQEWQVDLSTGAIRLRRSYDRRDTVACPPPDGCAVESAVAA